MRVYGIRFALAACACTAGLTLANPSFGMTGDCFEQAAAWQGVNANILRAISITENYRCDATVSRNKNTTEDTGCMQINDVHLPELAKFGITKRDLKDSCKNVFVGARHYKKMVARYGNTWTAVGAYHSETARERDSYARRVYQIWLRYGLNK